MYQDRVVLCGASSYEKKYYLNEDFKALPQQIQDELKIMCVLFTEDIGGVLTLVLMKREIFCWKYLQMKKICFMMISEVN